MPQRRGAQDLHIRAKAQDVAQQLALIRVGELQGVTAVLVDGALLFGVPLLGLHPASAYRTELQLGPVVGLATKNPIARLHDDANVLLAQLFGRLWQDVALHDRVDRKIQQLVAQVAPSIHIPVTSYLTMDMQSQSLGTQGTQPFGLASLVFITQLNQQDTLGTCFYKNMSSTLSARYAKLRQHTLNLAAPLSAEDQCVQSMPDASPCKWHLAHTSWFFENLVLLPYATNYAVFNPAFAYLFNSYYEALGPRHPRLQRGLLTRPPLPEVLAFRQHVDAAMQQLLSQADALSPQAQALIELGLNHEQQHQELLLTDALHLLSCNPLLPAYDAHLKPPSACSEALQWRSFEEDLHNFGQAADASDFAFDNETPRHQRFVQGFQIAHRLVNCGEYLAFIQDGGYDNPDLWLSEGRAQVLENNWQCPLYWQAPPDPRAASAQWQVFGLNGLQALDLQAPVANLSFYEASAFAQWAGARLPTEFEWEAASLHPGMQDMHGQVWQWTRSAYEPYPGFVPASGAVREYNGKFMVGQQVLRGSSLATPAQHSRHTYRNFFPASARWQFSGLRLAKDL